MAPPISTAFRFRSWSEVSHAKAVESAPAGSSRSITLIHATRPRGTAGHDIFFIPRIAFRHGIENRLPNLNKSGAEPHRAPLSERTLAQLITVAFEREVSGSEHLCP